jgi:hypothetical protein
MAHRISPFPAGYGEPAYDLLGVLGLTTGALSAVVTYGATRSPALSIGAFLLVSYLVGRVTPDLLVESDRVHHAAYLLISPVVGVSLALGALALAVPAWIAITAAVTIGGGSQWLIGRHFLPDVFAEEAGLDLDDLHLHVRRR